MRTRQRVGHRAAMAGVSLLLVLAGSGPGAAQTFSSGSTGADGAFAPSVNTTLALPADGVFNFTTVTIPAGVTVVLTPNAANTPVTILATGDVTVNGTLSVSASDGGAPATSGPLVNDGGASGPGGFPGGNGGARGGGLGPSAGQGVRAGGIANNTNTGDSLGRYNFDPAFVSLLPLVGGSGGGGATAPAGSSGAAGGGGGGAIVIASSTKITVTGAIQANGGDGKGVTCGSGDRLFLSGAGSGGALRLVAPELAGAGSLEAASGSYFGGATLCVFGLEPFGAGRIRLEAFTLGFTGSTDPTASVSVAPGPVTPASDPALVNLPTLTITSVGGLAPPSTPGGSYTTADVALSPSAPAFVSVTVTATNIPVPRTFTITVVPQGAAPTKTPTSPSSGSVASSTATASVPIPAGQVSVLNAFGSFTLPLVAGLFPLIDGEPVDRILVAAAYGGPSTLSLITTSGREIPAADLSPAEQLQLARAFALAQAANP